MNVEAQLDEHIFAQVLFADINGGSPNGMATGFGPVQV